MKCLVPYHHFVRNDKKIIFTILKIHRSPYLEQLQQFGKPTWHPYNFGKTRKIGLQQFGKPTWQK
jgi:hypothetical protein